MSPLLSSIASLKLTSEPGLERLSRLRTSLVEVDPAHSSGAETPPLAHERGIAEQRVLERQDVEARHVGGGLAPLEHEQLDGVGS